MSDPTIYDDDATGDAGAFLDPADQLSDVGRSRHDAMLPFLQAATVRQGRRRRVRRFAARGAVTASLSAAVVVALVNSWPTSNPPHVVQNDSSEGPQDRRLELVSIVQTDPGVLDRIAVNTSIDPAEYIVGDRQLVAMLAAIGRPTGLIRSQGRTWLTNAVTDRELAPPVETHDVRTPPSPESRAKRPS